MVQYYYIQFNVVNELGQNSNLKLGLIKKYQLPYLPITMVD